MNVGSIEEFVLAKRDYTLSHLMVVWVSISGMSVWVCAIGFNDWGVDERSSMSVSTVGISAISQRSVAVCWSGNNLGYGVGWVRDFVGVSIAGGSWDDGLDDWSVGNDGWGMGVCAVGSWVSTVGISAIGQWSVAVGWCIAMSVAQWCSDWVSSWSNGDESSKNDLLEVKYIHK